MYAVLPELQAETVHIGNKSRSNMCEEIMIKGYEDIRKSWHDKIMIWGSRDMRIWGYQFIKTTRTVWPTLDYVQKLLFWNLQELQKIPTSGGCIQVFNFILLIVELTKSLVANIQKYLTCKCDRMHNTW